MTSPISKKHQSRGPNVAFPLHNTFALALTTFGVLSIQLYLSMIARQSPLPEYGCSVGRLLPVSSAIWANDTTYADMAQVDQALQISMEGANNNFGGVEARAFPPWPYDSLPCFEPEEDWGDVQRTPSHEGFLMTKEVKTGGSTAAAIHLRIARNVAQRIYPEKNYSICKTRHDHSRATRLEYRLRRTGESFLWAVIRDPTKRTVSEFFHFEVSRNKVEPTDENFMEWLLSDDTLDSYYIKDMSVHRVKPADDRVQAANRVLRDYDFIGITERMDESAVALQLLLNLTTADVLFLNAKSSGGYDDGEASNGCTYIVPSFVSPGMKKYFGSDEWKDTMKADQTLYDAANRSLDLTILSLGKERFAAALARFQQAMKVVKEQCLGVVKFPCKSSGAWQESDCLWHDSGCGMNCLDKVSKEMGLYQHF